jgi:DNA mismatch repair protein MutS2
VFATTHLIGIKSFVYRREGMINASMEFDYKTQMPLYRLRVGEPGQSNALEIAGKFGLPQRVIDTAKGMLGSEKVELDFMISDLAEKRLRYEHDIEELGRRRRETEEKSRMLEEKLASSEVRMKEVLAGAYREAAEIVRMIKRQMYALLEDAKKKEREALREDIKEAELKQAEIGERLRAFEPIEDHTPSPEAMKAGDAVFVKSLGIDAFITGLNLKQGRVKVRAGSVEVEVPVSDISFGKGKPRPERETNVWYGTVAESASSRINLVGLRVDEALSRLEPFLNHAALAGLREVVIIHGIGKGILARAIRDHVTGHPLVEQFRSGEVTEGGAGVTIVTLA